jgi:hypothetical protein
MTAAFFTDQAHTTGGFVRPNGEQTSGPLPPIAGDVRAEYDAWLAAGNKPAAYVPPPSLRRLVPKFIIVDRLITAGKLAAARAALDAAPLEIRERWNAYTAIYADDETALNLLAAIGADPVTTLAP